MKKKNSLDLIIKILVIIGAINWGLVIWDVNIVTLILGAVPSLVTVVYALIGLSGLYLLYNLVK